MHSFNRKTKPGNNNLGNLKDYLESLPIHLWRRLWQVDIQVVNASLADPFYQRLSNKVDVILFNPPYVPTTEEEVVQAQDLRNIQGSWAGGSDGMQITYAFLDRVEVCIFISELNSKK